MTKRHIAWFASTFLLLAPAAPRAQTQPSPPAPTSASVTVAQTPGVLRTTLDNGLRVVIVPDRLAPVVTTELAYLVGSNDAPPGFPGTAHALEHMMFRGSKGLDRDQLFELSSLLGGISNASTTETVTQYTYTVPSSDLPIVLRAEALRMNGALLTQPDWEQERGAIEQEVSRDLSSPFYVVLAQMQAALFEGTPYENDALGTRPSFDATTAAELRKFYETWYRPNNAILVIAGDVDPARALDQVRTAFAAIPSRPVPAHAPITLRPVQPKTITLPTDLPVGIAALTYRMPGLAQPDFAAADILGDILASQRGPLYALVTAGRSLETQYAYEPKPDVGIALAISAFPGGADPAPYLADLRGVLADVAAGNFPEELVDAMKRQEVAKLAFASDSISGLAGAWARALTDQRAESPDDLARAYQAVTVGDVRRIAKQLLPVDNAIVAILTPRGTNAPTAASGFGGAETVGAPPDHPVTLPDWATAALAEFHRPPQAAQPEVTVLPNGLRIIVQPESVSPTVSVYGRIRQQPRLQEPQGQDGIADLTKGLFPFGTETHPRLAFLEAVDDIAADLSAGPDFALRVLAPQFERGVALLAENELHPAFPPEAVALVRQQMVQSLTGELRSPPYLFNLAQREAVVPKNDPTLRQPTPATVQALTPEAVRAWYAAAYRPDLTTIVVIGSVTPEEARRVITAAFGGWQAKGPTPDVDLPPIGVSAPSAQRVSDAGALQDQVALTEAITLPVASLDRYTLLLGNTILGGGFSSRLYRDLRVRTGYVYSVSSDLDFSRTRARYTISFGADPDKVDAARALALANIEDMQRNPVSDAELARAKAEISRRLAMARISVRSIASQYLRQVELGLPLDPTELAAAHYQATTAAQIQEAFARWLHPADLAQVTRGP